MDPDDVIIGQMGLILTQLRQARRALEDIERNTARYAGLAFAGLSSAGARFGEPPLLEGALKVHVVNINDLAPRAGGLGEFLGSLLAGVGGLVGGLGGGFLGAFLGGAALPYNLYQLRKIVEALGPLLKSSEGTTPPTPVEAADTGPSYLDRLPELTELVRALAALFPPITELVRALGEHLSKIEGPITRLFELFTGGSGKTETTPPPEPVGPPIDWVKFLQALTPIVDGLILLVPIAVGLLATLIVSLNGIQRSITDLLIWALRLVLLLRGAVLVVVWDTLAVAARVGSEVLHVLAGAVETILDAVFGAIESGIGLLLELLRLVSGGVGRVVDSLVTWLVGTIGPVLSYLGNLRLSQALIRFVDALYAVAAARYKETVGKEPPPLAGPFPGELATRGGTSIVPTAPDLAEALLPSEEEAKFRSQFQDAILTVPEEIGSAITSAGELLGGLEEASKRARTGTVLGEELGEALDGVQRSVISLGESFEVARAEGIEWGAGGLDVVAKAYEDWLRGGGLTTLLEGITEHFRSAPTTGPGAAESIPGRVVSGVGEAAERPRATVEIEELIIEVEPPTESVPPDPDSPLGPGDFELRLREYYADRFLRGERPELGFAFG